MLKSAIVIVRLRVGFQMPSHRIHYTDFRSTVIASERLGSDFTEAEELLPRIGVFQDDEGNGKVVPRSRCEIQ